MMVTAGAVGVAVVKLVLSGVAFFRDLDIKM